MLKTKVQKVSLPAEIIQNRIYLIRGQKVMLDSDLAMLYGVLTKQLKRQVRRNISRFPNDFMFQLTAKETEYLRCQFGTLRHGEHSKYLPYVFTEQGVAMLSSVLNSERAVQVNIQIVRVFVKLKEVLISHKDLARKIEDIERNFKVKFEDHDKKIIMIFEAIKELLSDKEDEVKNKAPIGFVPPNRKENVSRVKRK